MGILDEAHWNRMIGRLPLLPPAFELLGFGFRYLLETNTAHGAP
jgi:hypothetical protein